MDKHVVIVIGREYGSGGREIAEKLATRLGLPCYDKLIIDRIARNTNFSDEMIKSLDENEKNMANFVFNTYYGGMVSDISESVAIKVHVERYNVIREMAKNGSCIIVGRAADDMLRKDHNVFSIFVCASYENRVERVMERNNIDRKQAEKRIKKTDKTRADFYNKNSTRKWGVASTYDVCVRSDLLGVDETVEQLAAFILEFCKKNNLEI